MKKLSKVLVFILTFGLVISMFAGCSNNENNEQQNDQNVQNEQNEQNTDNNNEQEGTDNENTSDDNTEDENAEVNNNEENATDESYFPLDENVEISIFAAERIGMPQKSLMVEELEKRLNVTFNYVLGGQDNAANAEKLSLLVAGGDLPDIIHALPGEVQKYPDYIENLSDYEDVMPNLFSYINNEPETYRMISDEDGRIFFAPNLNQVTVSTTFMLRKDWLDRLELEIPETLDEYYEVMKAFAHDDPNGNGEADEIGYYPQGVKWWLTNFSNAWGIGSWNVIKGNEVVFGPREPEWKEVLIFLNKLYDEKIIDQQFITSTGKELESYVATGKIGFSEAFVNRVEQFNQWSRAADPDANWICILPPIGEDGQRHYESSGKRVGAVGAMGISTNCENKELAARVIDYMYSEEGQILGAWGVEGATYEVVNGERQFTQLVIDNEEYPNIRDSKIFFGIETGSPFAQVQDLEALAFADEVMDGISLYMEHEDMYMKGAPPTGLTIPYNEEEKPFTTQKWFEINTYKEEQSYKFIMGTRSFDEYDEFVEEMDSMGIEECMDAYTSAYQRYLNK